MGQQQSLATEIEINASPEHVRSVFMNFQRYPEWSQWKIEHSDSSKNTKSSDWQQGEGINVDLKFMKFSPTVVENDAETFTWLGKSFIFSGQHSFWWRSSQKTPGGTTMIQAEDFSGWLAFLMGPGWITRRWTLENWDQFLRDLKQECEKSSS